MTTRTGLPTAGSTVSRCFSRAVTVVFVSSPNSSTSAVLISALCFTERITPLRLYATASDLSSIFTTNPTASQVGFTTGCSVSSVSVFLCFFLSSAPPRSTFQSAGLFFSVWRVTAFFGSIKVTPDEDAASSSGVTRDDMPLVILNRPSSSRGPVLSRAAMCCCEILALVRS